ncbi:MAG: phosphoribosylformylglycinamidine synthase subunit PurS [Sphingobacteriales bacterium]|nr:MAG: phosphoribosylformylglycinamidine synthase subunit PurS [Sphingobacteriales bacterium]
MKFKAQIDVMPMEEILDPQGKVVTASLHNLGLGAVENVRIGKHIRLEVEAADKKTAEEMVDNACKKLLANMIMERYTFRLEEA